MLGPFNKLKFPSGAITYRIDDGAPLWHQRQSLAESQTITEILLRHSVALRLTINGAVGALWISGRRSAAKPWHTIQLKRTTINPVFWNWSRYAGINSISANKKFTIRTVLSVSSPLSVVQSREEEGERWLIESGDNNNSSKKHNVLWWQRQFPVGYSFDMKPLMAI